MLYFEFNYFDKFTIIKLIIKGAQNLNIIYSSFQKNLSLFRNLVSYIRKLNNVSTS